MDSQFLTDALTAEELEHIVTDVLGVLEVHADGAADTSGGGSAVSDEGRRMLEFEGDKDVGGSLSACVVRRRRS